MKKAAVAAEKTLEWFYSALTWRGVWLPVLTFVFALVLVYTTAFAVVLREDAYNFAVKGMEIARGDFSLDRPQAIGWPMLLGLVYRIMSVENIFEAMYVSRWVSISCTALVALLLGKICSVMFAGRESRGLAVLLVLAYMFNPVSFSMARSAMSEALFLLCVCGTVFFTVRAAGDAFPDIRRIALAALFAAASYYVRPNGLFVFAALLLVVVLYYRGAPGTMLAALCATAAVFVASVAPYLYARYAAFGSPFDYGPNSKYFVDEYKQVWADNVTAPTFLEFLGAHTIEQHYDRFVNRGLLAVIDDLDRVLEPPWLLLSLTGVLTILFLRMRPVYIVPLTLAVSLAGMSIVYAIFGSVRHLFYFLPLLLLCGGATFYLFDRYRVPARNIAATVLTLIVVADPPAVHWMGAEQRLIPQVQDHWAVWAANNIEGTVAIVEGGDFVKMSQHYRTTGWRMAKNFDEVDPHIRVWRPGIYRDLEEALVHFRANDVKYLITDRESMKRRPYLLSVSHPKWRRHFVHLGYFHLGGKGSRIPRVNIYRVVY